MENKVAIASENSICRTDISLGRSVLQQFHLHGYIWRVYDKACTFFPPVQLSATACLYSLHECQLVFECLRSGDNWWILTPITPFYSKETKTPFSCPLNLNLWGGSLWKVNWNHFFSMVRLQFAPPLNNVVYKIMTWKLTSEDMFYHLPGKRLLLHWY